MKTISLLVAALTLAACAGHPNVAKRGNHQPSAERAYGNDALPSAEVIAAQQVDARLKYANGRIEHDETGCAVYRGTAPDGQERSEPLLDPSGRPICVRR